MGSTTGGLIASRKKSFPGGPLGFRSFLDFGPSQSRLANFTSCSDEGRLGL